MSSKTIQKLVVLAGNPNVGKSTLFNQLTGSRQRIANYPGVTVERHEGCVTTPNGQILTVIDLPGTYSLNTKTEDEAIAVRAILGGNQTGFNQRPDAVVVIVEATKLSRSLLLFEQIRRIHPHVILAVNMMDELKEFRLFLDVAQLSKELGVPVVPLVAKNGEGVTDLLCAVERFPVFAANDNLLPVDLRFLAEQNVTETFRRIDALVAKVLRREPNQKLPRSHLLSDRLDRVLLHPVFGPAIFLTVMLVMFQALFTWSAPLMDLIDASFSNLGTIITANVGSPWLASLLADGVVAGVGSVLVFVPQIAITFVLIGFLEMSGYLARGAFLIDRLMRLFGLEGRAFIPLISSFACAIPGILATRTMPHPKQRLITTLIAPLMTCSARLPVYTLIIACFVPGTRVLGIFDLQGITLFGLFVAGIVMAMVMALIFKRIFAGKSGDSSFFMELPRYRLPTFKSLCHYISFRTLAFIKTAGTVIFFLSVILWALAYFPRPQEIHNAFETERVALTTLLISTDEIAKRTDALNAKEDGTYLRQSVIGRLGRMIEPMLEPMGFDWRLGIGVLTSFAAREVFVSTMGVVFNVGDADETSSPLRDKIKSAVKDDGTPAYTLATALALMIFYAFAAQCMSTLAVIKRETGSVKWALFSFGYMTVLAYVSSMLVYQFVSH